MKRILLIITILFTVLSSGMMNIVFHVCTSPEMMQPVKSCCKSHKSIPKCCSAENKLEVEPSVCCSNIQIYYITPKFSEGSKKKLSIPIANSVLLPFFSPSLALNSLLNTEVNLNQKPPDPPPNHPYCELNCVWII